MRRRWCLASRLRRSICSILRYFGAVRRALRQPHRERPLCPRRQDLAGRPEFPRQAPSARRIKRLSASGCGTSSIRGVISSRCRSSRRTARWAFRAISRRAAPTGWKSGALSVPFRSEDRCADALQSCAAQLLQPRRWRCESTFSAIRLRSRADAYLPVDDEMIPTGEVRPMSTERISTSAPCGQSGGSERRRR